VKEEKKQEKKEEKEEKKEEKEDPLAPSAKAGKKRLLFKQHPVVKAESVRTVEEAEESIRTVKAESVMISDEEAEESVRTVEDLHKESFRRFDGALWIWCTTCNRGWRSSDG